MDGLHGRWSKLNYKVNLQLLFHAALKDPDEPFESKNPFLEQPLPLQD